MSHYALQNPAYNSGGHHQQQPHQQHQQQPQSLAPISNLLPPDSYHQEPAAGAPILPPLQSQPPASYRHSYPGPHASQGPHTAQQPPTSSQHTSYPQYAPQHSHLESVPPAAAYPSTLATSSAAADSNRSSLSHHPGYGAAQTANSYPQASLPQLAPSALTHYDSSNGGVAYNQSQLSHHHHQPQHPPPPPPNRGGEDNRILAVVGSQGRRGILPTVAGKTPPSSAALDSSRSGTSTPSKNADGKYPCHYCNKTYLHLKHLKRHHLRHTGERPYQCCLCCETFCRSDILKRHFQKCSIRRGNPTGATHLQHAQAHLNQGNNGTPTSANSPSSGNSNAGQSNSSSAQYRTSWPSDTASTTNYHSFNPTANQMPSNGLPTPANESTRTSRSSSIMRPGSSGSDERKRYSEPNPQSHNNLAPMHMNMQMTPPNTDNRNSGHFVGHQNGMHMQQQQQQQHSSAHMKHDRYGVPPQGPHQDYYAPVPGHHQPNHNSQAHQQNPMHFSQAESQHGHMPFYQGGNTARMTYPGALHPAQQGTGHEQQWANCFTPGARDHMMFTG